MGSILRINVSYCLCLVEQFRIGPGGAQKTTIKTSRAKVFVTDGKDEEVTGICVFFIKVNPSRAINSANIFQVTRTISLKKNFSLRGFIYRDLMHVFEK